MYYVNFAIHWFSLMICLFLSIQHMEMFPKMAKLNGAEQAKASEIDFKHSSLPHWNISTAQLIRHFVCRLIDWTDNNNRRSNRSNKNSRHKL